jgi:hypothetical protein
LVITLISKYTMIENRLTVEVLPLADRRRHCMGHNSIDNYIYGVDVIKVGVCEITHPHPRLDLPKEIGEIFLIEAHVLGDERFQMKNLLAAESDTVLVECCPL